MARPLSSRATAPIVVVTSAVLGLGIAEVFVRTAGLAPPVQRLDADAESSPYVRSANPRLGFELKPSFRGDPSREYPFYLSTNAHGLRDVERSVARAPGRRRVILLGDSVVEGHGIRSLDDTMSRQLERELGDGAEVLGFGVSGYCTRAEVELLEAKGLAFDPDAVVLLFTENDFNDFNRKELELAYPRPRAAEILFARSHLFRLACLRLDLFRFRSESEPDAGRGTGGDDNVAEGLARLAELARDHGLDARIAVWPRFLDDRIVDVHFMTDERDRLIVERIAGALGLPVTRLSAGFREDLAARKAPPSPRRLYTVGDKLHPSVEGCRVAARAIAAMLAEPAPAVAAAAAGGPDRAAVALARAASECQLHVDLGDAMLAASRPDDAIAHFREALEIDPSLVDVRTQLATLLQERGDDVGAMEELRSIVGGRPDDPAVRFNLAVALERRGDTAEARALYEEALALDPDYEMARLNLGILSARSGDLPGAIAHFEAAVRSDPSSARAWNNLGLALTVAGRASDAVPVLERAIVLRPDYAEARNNLRLARERLARQAPAGDDGPADANLIPVDATVPDARPATASGR
jgi:Flp pilus assembly protein TadD/lysophospholipase L1-like esterase